MSEVNLLRSLPKTKRDIKKRQTAKDLEVIKISKQYGKEYFDGDRKYGYGGYNYDGRWLPVAKDIVEHFGLKSGDKVLDIGCAKGFLVKDLMTACPGLEAQGIDVSRYALDNCEIEVEDKLFLGSADSLPFDDNSFDCAIAINSIHNLPREKVVLALKEINRVTKTGKAFIQVDSYLTPEQKELFEDWVLTAEFHDYPAGWIDLFQEAEYTGDYNWTIVK